MAEYRIVRDDYAGYEVQARRWWWPFWWQTSSPDIFSTNTKCNISGAEDLAEWHAKKPIRWPTQWFQKKVVKHLGQYIKD